MIFYNGDWYIGEFENNDFSGKGKYIWSNGDYYEGNFKGSHLFGTGTLYYWNGVIGKGNWDLLHQNSVINYELDSDS